MEKFSYDSPIETLTFLSTDIEGSTALLRRLGDDAYSRALDVHHRVIRDALRAHDGREVGTQGDSFFATFTSPSACVAAVLQMQLGLAEFEWPGGEQLRVRMGVHSGEASEAATGLVGYEVHRAARIGQVAHGGQVLLSSTTAGLVEDALPSDVALRGLGSHRLKDLGRPEALFQLVAPGLRDDFPPLRSLDNPELPNNLPASLKSFVGRTKELAEVVELLQASRLITLTGAGGAGKTRLALQAAAEVLDGSGEGVWFVELAPVSDPDLVATTVIAALELRQEAGRSDLDALLHALKEQNCLVVLDNCEHLVDAVAKLIDLIARTCPKVSIMATSREPLGVDGEEVYRVRSLSLPPSDAESAEDVLGSDSVDLFVARARSLDKGFEVTDANAALVGAICRRLDGIPLAIELAAARLSSMSLQNLHDRLDQRFRLLTGGSRNALPRQQTLGAMVAWSYDLLNPPEREVLRRLTVFVDGFTLEAAEAVCATETVESFDVADIVGSLVNKSLVVAERGETTLRYALLETIRQFAAEQLLQVDGEVATLEARRMHAEYYLALCEEQLDPSRADSAQAAAMRRMDPEVGNLFAALDTFAARPNDAEKVGRLCWACLEFTITRVLREVAPYLRDLLESDAIAPIQRARALVQLVELTETWDVSDDQLRANAAMYDEAIAISSGEREVTDEAAVVRGLRADLTKRLGNRELALEEVAAAVELARSSGQLDAIGWTLWLNGVVIGFGTEADRARARPFWFEAANTFAESGNLRGRSWALLLASFANYSNLEELAETRRLHEEALAAAQEIGAVRTLTEIWDNLSLYCYLLDDLSEAESHARRSLASKRRLGQPLWAMYISIFVLAGCARSAGDFERAALLAGAFERANAERSPHFGAETWTEMDLRAQAELHRALEAELGTEAFSSARAAGRRMSTDQVVGLALGRARPADLGIGTISSES